MKFNEAQQKERIASGLGSVALSLDILVLIALAKFAGPVLAIVWGILSLICWVIHSKQVTSLADPPSEKDLFTCSGEVRTKES